MICACGKEFEKTHGLQKFCNRKCKDKYNPTKLDKEYGRAINYKLCYGITIEDYNRMFEEQGGCCKICKRHQSEFKKRLHVDHCHKTKRVRGLLCFGCNIALGKINDNPAIIEAMLEYLN